MIVGILGAGGIGTLLGAILARSCEVRMLVRDNRSARAIADRGGLVLDGGTPQRAIASSDPSAMQGVDVVLVALKTYAVGEAIASIRASVTPHVPVVSFSNGAAAVTEIEYGLGRHVPVALAPTTEGVARIAAGVAQRTGRGNTPIGWASEHDGDDTVLDRLIDFLSRDLAIERVQPIEPHVWAKVIANAAINPLTALAGVTNGGLLERPDLRARAARIANEAYAIAVRGGIALPFEDPVAHVEAVARQTAANRSSMLVDFEAGTPTEIEAITGAVVRAAAALGVAVPENARVLDEVRARRRA